MKKAVFPMIEEFKEGLMLWQKPMKDFTDSAKFTTIYKFVKEKYEKEICYPPVDLIFNAYRLTSPDNVKVVIVGQDPYHQPGQAMGLSFSVPRKVKIPPSLVNIFKAIKEDPKITNFKIPDHGDLTKWAQQGVFLLNDVLTVTQSKPASHAPSGWSHFTHHTIKWISHEKQGVIFLLWGSPAQKKKALIDLKKHTVLESVHPSPLSAHKGFLTCGHFSKVNEILKAQGKTEIDWNLD